MGISSSVRTMNSKLAFVFCLALIIGCMLGFAQSDVGDAMGPHCWTDQQCKDWCEDFGGPNCDNWYCDGADPPLPGECMERNWFQIDLPKLNSTFPSVNEEEE